MGNITDQALPSVLGAEGDVVVGRKDPVASTLDSFGHQEDHTPFSQTKLERRGTVLETRLRRFGRSRKGDAALLRPPKGVEGISVPHF